MKYVQQMDWELYGKP